MSELLNYSEIKRRLKKPIDKKFISQKTQGGAKINFVNITDIKDILDERIAPNHWEAIIKQTCVAGDSLLIIVSLIIHASDGAYCQDGTGTEKTVVKGYGDTASNAYAQALRRAAESHGLGRELWRMELSDEQIEIQREANKPSIQQRIQNAQKAIRDLGGQVEVYSFEGKSELENLEELTALTEQYKRLKQTKEGK